VCEDRREQLSAFVGGRDRLELALFVGEQHTGGTDAEQVHAGMGQIVQHGGQVRSRLRQLNQRGRTMLVSESPRQLRCTTHL
jgi:hypothetical protein